MLIQGEQDHQAYLAKLLEGIGEAIIMTDLEFAITGFNKAAEEIYGWPATEVLGKSISEIARTEYIDVSGEEAQEQFLQTGIWRGEVFQYTRNGKKLRIDSSVSYILDDQKNPIAALAINRNITLLWETNIALTRSEALWKAFARALPDIAFVIDAEGRYREIIASNPELLIAEEKNLLNHTFADVLPPDLAEQLMKVIEETIETGQSQTIEYILPLEQGETWFEARSSLLRVEEDTEPLIVFLVRDISQRIEAEEQRMELESLRLSLEKEIEMNYIRNKMLTTISHELRTPLSIINLAVELFTRDEYIQNSEKFSRQLATMRKQIHYLSEVIEDVSFTVATLKGEVDFTPARLQISDVVEKVILSLHSEVGINTDRIQINIHNVEEVFADKGYLHLLLSHLLTNALKYSSPDSPVQCDFYEKDDRFVIEVADQGVGIPESDKLHIFDPHYRSKNVETIQGIGLGLTIVRTAVDLHKGSIKIESVEGEGTTFTVQLRVLIPDEQ